MLTNSYNIKTVSLEKFKILFKLNICFFYITTTAIHNLVVICNLMAKALNFL